nr:larval cuticle protein 2 [Drosophila virilis]
MICAFFGMAVALSPGLLHGIRPVAHPVRSSPVGHGEDVHAEVLSRKDDVRADGFDASLETSNHISRAESGDEHGNIHGSFAWVSPEGEQIQISYVADENGYQPQGAALPTPPPIPVEIERALAWIAAHPPAPEKYSHH